MKSFYNLIDSATRTAIQQDRAIKQVISRIVPARALPHVQFCRLEGGRLRVTVDTAAWVAKLRFSERQIIDALRAEQLDVVTMSFHVAPASMPEPRRTVRTPNNPPEQVAVTLSMLAEERLAEESEAPAATLQKSGHPAVPGQGHTTRSHSVVRQGSDERLRQALLKLASSLRSG